MQLKFFGRNLFYMTKHHWQVGVPRREGGSWAELHAQFRGQCEGFISLRMATCAGSKNATNACWRTNVIVTISEPLQCAR